MILLTQPYYNSISAESAKSFYSGATARPYRTATVGGSLLAATFNQLWAIGLTMRREGVNRFGMLHPDCFAASGWADILLNELEATGADWISAVVPIKDGRGVTSTAVDTDAWRPRRLTMREVMRMPDTFSSPDQGNLLVNTGCFVCRFDSPWVEQVRFTINDRIIQRDDGKWVADVEPEDWNMSRQLHALGCKVLATRKVKVNHIGTIGFSNDSAWGSWEYDQDNAEGVSV